LEDIDVQNKEKFWRFEFLVLLRGLEVVRFSIGEYFGKTVEKWFTQIG